MIGDVVAPAPGRLGDGRIEQVGADRDLRGHAEARDEERRHQRAAADARQPHEKAHAEASENQRQETCRPAEINHEPQSPPGSARIVPALPRSWNFSVLRFR